LLKRTITLLILLSCSLSSRVIVAQQVPTQKQTKKLLNERSHDIENLLNRSRSLPAEFAIDVFLRVQKSKRVDSLWRKEILEEAFTLTPNVQSELREKAIPFPDTPVDTRAGYRSAASALNLDSLSSRSHIIDEMLSIDQSAALRMLNEMPAKLPFKTRPCSAQTEYDVSDFYRVIGKVARTIYGAKQIKQGERVQFILPYVEGMSSPTQIEPLTNLIISLGLRQRESFIISQAFANAVKKISVDDRSFSAALISNASTNSVLQLVNLYRKTGVPYHNILSEYRSYLQRHFQAVRCEDTVKSLEQQIKEINWAYPDNALSIDELKPLKVEEVPRRKPYFQSSDTSALLNELRDLRGYDDDEPSLREPHTSPSWQEKMLDFLGRLEAWNGNSEIDDEDYFHQKSILYKMLLRIAPAGPLAEQVVFGYLKLLNNPKVINESRVEWLWHVNELIRYLNETPGDERMRWLNLLANSKNPILQVYADLAKTNL